MGPVSSVRVLAFVLLFHFVFSFGGALVRARRAPIARLSVVPNDDIESPSAVESDGLRKALESAKKNRSDKTSPGAGLQSAEEQAEAAYADLILTSSGSNQLTDSELQALEKGGTMWESESKETNKLGKVGDIFSLAKALLGGAHIVKNKFGET